MVYILYSAFHMSGEPVPGHQCGHKKSSFRNEEHKPYLKIACMRTHAMSF